jgi:hypothetical protein
MAVMRLFDLFGDLTAVWPPSIVGPGGGTPNPQLASWIADLNDIVTVTDIRTGVLPGSTGNRASVAARLAFAPGNLGYVDGFPFSLPALSKVAFKLQPLSDPDNLVRLFASVTDTGAEIVLEGVPLEIILPGDLLLPPNDASGHVGPEVRVGDFSPGRLDDLRVVYRPANGSSIFVHARLRFTADGQASLRAAVPIDFGRCTFSGFPCIAVHDFILIPSPALAMDEIEWLRHDITPWVPATANGQFSVRSFHFDPSGEPFKSAADSFNKQSTKDPTAEFVLDDLVVPFLSSYVVPVPRHLTVGMRRAVLSWQDPGKVFDFAQVPVRIVFGGDPKWGLLIEKLFFQSEPAPDVLTFLGGTELSVQIFRETDKTEQAFGLELGEDVTPRLVYRRGFIAGLPEPQGRADGTIDSILHVQIGPVSVDLMGVQVGYSLGRALGKKMGFGDCFEFLADLFVSVPPFGDDSGPVNLRGLSGEKVAFAMQGIGWKQGGLHFEGIAFPDGVVLTMGPVKLIVRELSVIAESGASYLSFSAGVALSLSSGFSGSVEVRRMRFRLPGHPSSPFFKMDGFFIHLKFTSPQLEIEFGGLFVEDDDGVHRRKEFGLTGTVKLPIGATNYTFGGDFLVGHISSLVGSTLPVDNFSYVMIETFFRGQITICFVELRGAQVLVAVNMLPALGNADRDAGELRYYTWYKRSNPLYVSGDRRLAAWNPHQPAFTGGIGVMASFVGCGSIVELSLFILGVISDDERGLLIALEARLLSNPEPVAWGVIEWDAKNGTFSFLTGVELSIDKLMKNPPDWLKNIARLSGTIFAGNQPGRFAIGHISDMNTWMSLLIDKDLWGFGLHVQIGSCFEWTEGVLIGGGLVVQVRSGLTGVITLEFNVGFGAVFTSFATGSTDWALVVWIEGAFRFVLFRFLKFGVSARAELRIVGRRPAHGSISLDFNLEMPWWLPDVRYTLAYTWGDLMPASLASSVQPLRSAGGSEGSSSRSQALHCERFDNDWDGTGTPSNYSIIEFQAPPVAEADRVARFEADNSIVPLATDATISIDLSVVVNDKLALDANVSSGGGDQKASDLSLSYDFVGIGIRRRSRFGADRAWTSIDERLELPPSFSSSTGVDLSGSFGPQTFTKMWDVSSRVDNKPVAKKLLLNASTPFEFATRDPAGDEDLARRNPAWPCCPSGTNTPQYGTHEILFRQDPLGENLTDAETFTNSQSRLQFVAPAFVHPQVLSTTLQTNTRVAVVSGIRPATVFRATLDEDAAYCFVRLAWGRSTRFCLALLGFDDVGKLTGARIIPLSAASDFTTVSLSGDEPIRRFELRLVDLGASSGIWDYSAAHVAVTAAVDTPVEIDRIAYISLRDVVNGLLQQDACSGLGGSASPFGGNGKVFLLPNSEYEVAITCRLTISHPSTTAESADVTEWVYFRTKGLPGLNAVSHVGEELEPHIENAYTGGRGVLYREEPVSLAFTEGMTIAVPLALRPPGGSDESYTLMEMQLLVRPEIASESPSTYTATNDDWLIQHRSLIVEAVVDAWLPEFSLGTTIIRNTTSIDPYRQRLSLLTQRPEVTCNIPDAMDVTSAVLVAPPQGAIDDDDPSIKLWPARRRHTAIVRQKGAPFVDRRPFVAADATAFDWVRDDGSSSVQWGVDNNGALHAPAGAGRLLGLFGEESWNHVLIETAIVLTGASAGIGVALPGTGAPIQGLFAVVESSGGVRSLALYRRTAGVQMDRIAGKPLPDDAAVPDPQILLVYAFDDVFRAQVGDVVVETSRGNLREGRVAVVAQEEALFNSLRIEGLDMYVFSFSTSQFKSFHEHIGTYQGAVDVLTPNVLGAGTSPMTPAAIFNRADIVAAMDPQTAPEERQSLFDKWIQDVGIPLKNDVRALELSCYRIGTESWFLMLESPEDLDFTEEVTSVLTVRTWKPIARNLPGSSPLTAQLQALGHSVPASIATARASRRALTDAVLAREAAAGNKSDPTLTQTSAFVIRDAMLTKQGMRITIMATSGTRPAGQLVFAQSGKTVADTKYFAAAHPMLRAGMTLVLDAVPMPNPGAWSSTPNAIVSSSIQSDAIWAVGPDLRPLGPPYLAGSYVWQEIDVLALQGGTGRRVLILPVGAPGLMSLGSGDYRLELKMSRERWRTANGPDVMSHYEDTATLSFHL